MSEHKDWCMSVEPDGGPCTCRDEDQPAVKALIGDYASPTASELMHQGGEWLGAARSWLQWHRRNGSEVTWGSEQVLLPYFTAHDVEDLAAHVAAAAMRKQPSEVSLTNSLRARWKAEQRAYDLVDALKAIRDHVFADLPEETAPPRNRLQVIAAKVDNILHKVGVE